MNGEEYFVIFNEGDSKDYLGYVLNIVGFFEEIWVKDVFFLGIYLIYVIIYLFDCLLWCKVM